MRRFAFGAGLMLLFPSVWADEAKPPVLEYGSTRESTATLRVPGNGEMEREVAVGEGVAWQGVKVYLGVLSELVAVDEATGRVLWSEPVSAFWGRIGFEKVEGAWAVVLGPAADETVGKDKVQRHDLRTGRRLETPETLPGKALDPAPTCHEVPGAGDGPAARLVDTPERWAGARLPALEGVDLTRDRVLVLAGAFRCEGVYEAGDRIVVRLRAARRQQTTEGAHAAEKPPTRLLVVLPRSAKPVALERDVQPYIGGPAVWAEFARLERP